jgi:tetratricopeptide (TPR) repeat protein
MDLILFRLAWGLDEMQQQQRARQVYHRLIRGHPRSPYVAESYVRFGDYYWRQGDLSAARQFYETAATMDAGDASAYARYMAAWCHHRLGDRAQARQSVNTARALLAQAASGTARALAAALERDACTLAR